MNEKEKAVIEAAVEYFYSGKEGVRFQILNLAVQNYLISQKATEHISDMAEKLISDVMNNREKLVKAWIAETGIRPDEAEIIERRDGNTVYISVRRKESSQKSADIEAIVYPCAGNMHPHFSNEFVIAEKLNEVISTINELRKK